MKQQLLIFFIFIAPYYLYSRSVVYNFRIAQITKEHIFEPENKRPYTLIGLLFDEVSQKRYNDIHRNYFGGLGTFIYNWESYFLRADFAISKINEKSYDSHFADTQTDDFLITLGKNFFINKNADVTLSGLFGFPTHPVYALRKPADFGFGQFGIGAQLDSVYRFNPHNSLLLGGRYLYFIPRRATDAHCMKHIFTVGNIIDFLLASKNIWGKHGLEIGYTPRFSFGAKVYPSYDDIIEKTNYIRSTWYAVYQYKFKYKNMIHRFLFNIASGFDVTPKRYGHKYIVFLWAAWDLKF